MRLQEVLPDFYRQMFDITAKVGAYQDNSNLSYDLWNVGVRHEDIEGALLIVMTLVLTTSTTSTRRISLGTRSSETVSLYSNRLSVETFTQVLKEAFGLEVIPALREAAVTRFLLVVVLMLLVSRYLLRRIQVRFGPTDYDSIEETTGMQPKGFSKRFQRFSDDILKTMAEQLDHPWDDVGLVILEGNDRSNQRSPRTDRARGSQQRQSKPDQRR
jgi:hypothetical protein